MQGTGLDCKSCKGEKFFRQCERSSVKGGEKGRACLWIGGDFKTF